jgi:hypothetical protein
MTGTLHITGDDAADELLSEDPLALLIGMLLDQQVPMETAFSGPLKIKNRLGAFDAATIADQNADAFAELFRTPPAVHRYPGNIGTARADALPCDCRRVEWPGIRNLDTRRPRWGRSTQAAQSAARVRGTEGQNFPGAPR